MIATVAAVLLGAALVLAGGAKIAAGPAWPAQATEMDAPRWVVPVLPWAEMLIGVVAIVAVGDVRRIAVTAAALLVMGFSVQIARVLRSGRRPVCACFGSWSARPLGMRHLWRNLVLIALAVVAVTA